VRVVLSPNYDFISTHDNGASSPEHQCPQTDCGARGGYDSRPHVVKETCTTQCVVEEVLERLDRDYGPVGSTVSSRPSLIEALPSVFPY